MRIVYDYGLGINLPGLRPASGMDTAEKTDVLIIRIGEKARTSEGAFTRTIRTRTDRDEGIPIPGTDYVLTISEEAIARDSEVRRHEQAHLAVLGGTAKSGISLITKRGADGNAYAVGGSIKVDLASVPGDPRATLKKAKTVIRAALAPGSPSSADLRTAAEAYRLARHAKEELLGEGYFA